MSYETLVLEKGVNAASPEQIYCQCFADQVLCFRRCSYQNVITNNDTKKYQLDHLTTAVNIINERYVIVDEDENLAEIPFEAEMSQAIALNALQDYKKKSLQDKRNLKVIPVTEVENSDMTVSNPAKLTFLPWIKTGLGALVPDIGNVHGSRPKISIQLDVRKYDQSNNPSDETITKDFLLYGPGDIVGFLKNTIVRTAPLANEMNFEPNYFPYVEFSHQISLGDILQARPAESQPGRLPPWISLIVLRENEFDRTTVTQICPQINIRNPQLSSQDLEQSWASAHMQVTQEIQTTDAISAILASEPHLVISRILCLRKPYLILLIMRLWFLHLEQAYWQGLDDR